MTREQLRIADYLGHILEAIERIGEYTEDVDEVTFLGNKMIQDAVLRNIEIIGEAARNIERTAPDFAAPSIPKLPGRLSTPCATASRTVISRSILKLSGEPCNEIYRNWRLPLAR